MTYGKFDLACPTEFRQTNVPGDEYTLGPKKFKCCPQMSFDQQLPEGGCGKLCDCCPKIDWYSCNTEEVKKKRIYYMSENLI